MQFLWKIWPQLSFATSSFSWNASMQVVHWVPLSTCFCVTFVIGTRLMSKAIKKDIFCEMIVFKNLRVEVLSDVPGLGRIGWAMRSERCQGHWVPTHSHPCYHECHHFRKIIFMLNHFIIPFLRKDKWPDAFHNHGAGWSSNEANGKSTWSSCVRVWFTFSCILFSCASIRSTRILLLSN